MYNFLSDAIHIATMLQCSATDSECIVDLGLKELAGLVRVGQAEGLSDGLGQHLLKDSTGWRA